MADIPEPDDNEISLNASIKATEDKIAEIDSLIEAYEKDEKKAIAYGEKLKGLIFKDLKEKINRKSKEAEAVTEQALDLENWGSIASKIAENPEEQPFKLMNKTLKWCGLPSFEEKVLSANRIFNDWTESLKSNTDKKAEAAISEFLFGPEKARSIVEAFPQYFNQFHYQGDQSKLIDYWYSPEAWVGVSEAYYQEAAWRRSVVGELQQQLLKLEWALFMKEISPDQDLPTQPTIDQLREMKEAQKKRKEEQEKLLEDFKRRRQDLINRGAQRQAASDVSKAVTDQADEANQRAKQDQRTQGYNATDSQLRIAPYPQEHSSTQASKSNTKSSLQESEWKRVNEAGMRMKEQYTHPGRAVWNRFLSQFGVHLEREEKLAEKVNNEQLKEQVEQQRQQIIVDQQTREWDIRQQAIEDQALKSISQQNGPGPSKVGAASSESIGASVGFLAGITKSIKGFAESKAIAAVLAAVPTGVSQAIAAAILIKNYLAKLPLMQAAADLWSKVKRGIAALGIYVVAKFFEFFGNVLSIFSGGSALGGTATAAGVAIPAVGVAAPGASGGLFGLGASSTTAAAGGGGASGFGGFMASAAAPPIIAVGAVGAVTLITVITVGAAFAEQAEDHLDQAVSVSFDVTKNAEQNAFPDFNKTLLADVKYKMDIAAKEKITITDVNDQIVRYSERDPKEGTPIVPKNLEKVTTPLALSAGETKTFSDNETYEGDVFRDSLVVNTLTVTAKIGDSGESQTLKAVEVVTLGNPPANQPYGYPIAGTIKDIDDQLITANGKTYAHCGTFLYSGGIFPDGSRQCIPGGMDLSAAGGTVVRSTVKGKVIKADFDYGNGETQAKDGSQCPNLSSGITCGAIGGFVYIQDETGLFTAAYIHLDQVTTESEVERGDAIGVIYSGKLPTTSGPHVHYQVLIGNGNDPFANSYGSCKEGKLLPTKPENDRKVPPSEVPPVLVCN